MKRRILVIAAHPDDEVLGCGGSIAKHIRNNDDVFLLVLTDGESSRQNPQNEIRNVSLEASCKLLGIRDYKFLSLKDSLLDSYPILEVIQEIETYARSCDPHIVYTHLASDINQDHRVAYLATMTAFRPLPDSSLEMILCYEVPSNTEWSPTQLAAPFVPNYFEALSPEDVDQKFRALGCYENELRPYPHPRSIKYIQALLTIRGATVGTPDAEAFYLERFVSKNY
jgi:LmbE family N-acetylglucosaminyl deacetylase